MNEAFSMQGKQVLITGGTRGIGRAIALELAKAGARVAANFVRDTASADALRAEATTAGASIETIRADLTTEKGMGRLMEALDAGFPTLSGIIHCAATGVHRPVQDLTLRQFDWTFGVNVRAFFELVHRLLPRLENPSSILALSSEGAVRAVPNYALVGSSKGALESLVRHFAVELAPRGIRVNALAPGSVVTDAWKVLPDADVRLAEAKRRTPLGRLVTLEEVARTAHFLCSDAASGIIGQTIVVDGGIRVRE